MKKHLQGGPPGRGQPFVDTEELRFRNLYCCGTFNLLFTNCIPRPDGPPCIYMLTVMEAGAHCTYVNMRQPKLRP